MRVGMIARRDHTGLGYQTYEFWKHVRPDVTLVLDFSRLNRGIDVQKRWDNAGDIDYGEPRSGLQYLELTGFPRDDAYPQMGIESDLTELLSNIDVLFSVETFYWQSWLLKECRDRGIKTVLQYNHEFLDALVRPELRPDELWAPTTWLMDRVPGAVHVPVPLPDWEPVVRNPSRNQSAPRFMFANGTGTGEDRNGFEFVKRAVEACGAPPVDVYSIVPGTVPDHENLRDMGPMVDRKQAFYDHDVLLMPRRFGGLCLSAQEMAATGGLVIMTGVPPQEGWDWPLYLSANPDEPLQCRDLLPTWRTEGHVLASLMNFLVKYPKQIKGCSESVIALTEGQRWPALLPEYNRLLGR